MKTTLLPLAALTALCALHTSPAHAAPDPKQRQMSPEDIAKALRLLEADEPTPGRRPPAPAPAPKTDPFFDALWESDSEVKKAYTSFDYEAVVRSRKAFLKAWQKRLPKDPEDAKRARADLHGCEEEITYASTLARAWARVEKDPARHLPAFLKRLLHPQGSRRRAPPRPGSRRYSEEERQGLVDLILATFPKARAWRDARFPVALKIARGTDSEVESLVRAALDEKLGAYGWKVRNAPDPKRDLPVLEVSASVTNPSESFRSMLPTSTGLISMRVRMHLVLRHGEQILEDETPSTSGLGLDEATARVAGIEGVVVVFRSRVADHLIQAVASGTL